MPLDHIGALQERVLLLEEVCISQPPAATTKYLAQLTYREKSLIWVHGLEVPDHNEMAPLYQASGKGPQHMTLSTWWIELLTVGARKAERKKRSGGPLSPSGHFPLLPTSPPNSVILWTKLLTHGLLGDTSLNCRKRGRYSILGMLKMSPAQ